MFSEGTVNQNEKTTVLDDDLDNIDSTTPKTYNNFGC